MAEIRKKSKMDQHDKKDNEKQAGEGYESPKLVRVSLRPEEAVLGHCKVTGSGGPASLGLNCHPTMLPVCRVPGS
jgi:hypothetical protein